MTHEDIPLPPAVRCTVTLLLETVARGLARCVWQFGEPALAWRSNAGVMAGVRSTLTRMRRLHLILRYVFVILAAYYVEATTLRSRRTTAHGSARPVLPDDPATWRTSFVSSAPYHAFRDAGARPKPAQFAHAPRAPLQTLARKMEGLRRALAHPMRHIRRLARILRGGVAFFRWRPPKRPPPTAKRADWEELLMGFEQARFEVRRLNTS